MTEQAQEQIDADIAGQKLSIKTGSLNTIATVATLLITCLIAYALMTHGSETRDAGKEFVQAMRDMTRAAREQNCLISLPQERREQNAEICKRISQ